MNYPKSAANRMSNDLLCFFLTAFCVVFLTRSSQSQIGTIGSGSGTSSILPFASYSGSYTYSQQIYTKAELNSAGLTGPGHIQSISFYCENPVGSTQDFNQISVFMGNISPSTFNSSSDWTPAADLTELGIWTLPSALEVGWVTFSLSQPFFWDGNSNVIIAMDENQSDWGAQSYWRVFTIDPLPQSGYMSICNYSYYNNPDAFNPPTANSISNTRNQIQISFLSSTACSNVSDLLLFDIVNGEGQCMGHTLNVNAVFDNYIWKKDSQIIPGAVSSNYSIPVDQNQSVHSYVCEAYCEATSQTLLSNSLNVQSPGCFADYSSSVNYMLVQNVTTTGINTSNQTAQIQFDLNWGYAWKDSINWDAAWIFMKYKNAAGEWKPCKLKTTGFDNGQGSPNNIQVPADLMGAFVSLSQFGHAHMNIQGMQLQWDYSGLGISNPGLLEVKVFAIEMVYIPQGDFNTFSKYQGLTMNAPGDNYLVVNNRLSPNISWIKSGSTSVGQTRVQGNIGIDLTANGSVESVDYPTGYTPFYMCKYEMSEQQYADFLNCLTTTQRGTLGVAGSSITTVNGVRYASEPNRACNGYALNRFLAYADWAGLRPMSILEYSKAALGPYKLPPASTSNASSNQVYVSKSGLYPLGGNFQNSATPKNVGEGDSNNSQAYNSGTGYYGVKDMGGNVTETAIGFSSSFSKLIHGNGVLATSGVHDVTNWNSLTEGSNVFEIEPNNYIGEYAIPYWNTRGRGFRYARTAE